MSVSSSSVNPFDFSQHAQKWVDNGYGTSLIPLKSGQKAPSENDWRNVHLLPSAIVERARQGEGVGLLMEDDFVVFDIEHSAHAELIFKLVIGAVCDFQPMYRTRTNSFGRNVLFALSAPLGHTIRPLLQDASLPLIPGQKSSRVIFEVLTKGKQCMVEGHHPEGMLDWHNFEHRMDLLTLTPDEVRHVVAEVAKGLAAHGILDGQAGQIVQSIHAHGSPNANPVTTAAERGDVQDDLDLVRALVFLVPNHDKGPLSDYDEWIKFGQALSGATQGLGREIWNEWCAQRPQTRDPDDVWKTFKDPKRGWSHLLEQVAAYGDANQCAGLLFAKTPFVIAPNNNPKTGKERYLAARIWQRALSAKSSTAPLGVDEYGDIENPSSLPSVQPPIIENLIYPGMIHGLIAAPGVGKSTLFNLAIAATSRGVHYHTLASLPVVPHVFALFGEDSRPIVVQRHLATVQEHWPNQAPVHGAKIILQTDEKLELASFDQKTQRLTAEPPPGLHRLCDALELLALDPSSKERPLSVYLDMLKDTFFGDENKKPEVEATVRVYKAIMQVWHELTGQHMGIVFSHHTTKQNAKADDQDNVRYAAAGSIAIEGAARLQSYLYSDKDTPKYVKQRIDKSNYGKTGLVLMFERKERQALGRPAGILSPVDINTAQADQAAERLAQVQAWAEAVASVIDHGALKVRAGVKLVKADDNEATIKGIIIAAPNGKKNPTDQDAQDVKNYLTGGGGYKVVSRRRPDRDYLFPAGVMDIAGSFGAGETPNI